jgi:hypothetical protein
MVAAAEIERIGEVIESSKPRFTAQACELNGAPGFGTFVKTYTPSVSYGLVFDI